MGIEELGLQCSESGSDFSFSDSVEEDWKQERNLQEEVESERYIEELGSDSEAESELSLKDWLDENNQTKIEFNHLQDVAQTLDPVKAEKKELKQYRRRRGIEFSINPGLEVDGENKLGLKPKKRMKSKTDSGDSTDEFEGFSFFGKERAVVRVKDNSIEENNSQVSTW